MVGYILGGISFLLISFLVHLNLRLKKRISSLENRDFYKKFEMFEDISKELNYLIENTNIQRALILKTHNGDGKPRFGRPLYVSAVYEVCRDPFEYQVNTYKMLKVDDPYLQLLLDIKEYQDSAFFVSSMKESMLRRFYEAEGVNWSYIYKIGADSTGMYYGSFATSQNDTPFQLGQGATIEAAIHRIRGIYTKLNIH